jgi:roadblock/LC7 domain-containing protein
MITFEQFYLTENLFYSGDAQAGGYLITYDQNTALQLGEINDEGNTLVCKFVGELKKIGGTATAGVGNKSNNVYIGYRSINQKNMRVAAMAAIKGTANKLKKNPNAAGGYKGLNLMPYYKKEHFALTNEEYNNFIMHAINDFAAKTHRRYGVFVFPDSRSHNAEDVCNALKQVIGTNNSYVTPLYKKTVTQHNIANFFDIESIAEEINDLLPQNIKNMLTAEREDNVTPIQVLVAAIRENLLDEFRNKQLSTASDTRPVSMDRFMKNLFNNLDINLPNDQPLLGGHLDAFTHPHYDIQAFLHSYNIRNEYPPEGRGGTNNTYNRRLELLKAITQDKTKSEDQKNTARYNISNIKNEQRILIVDDNINTGDMYKQVKEIVNLPEFRENSVDFFYLMCKNDYNN